MVGHEAQVLLHRLTVQGKPVVRRGRKARDLPRKTARLPGNDDLDRLKGVGCEGQPGAPHMGPGACGVDGSDDRRRTALVGLMTRMLKAQAFRVLLAIGALASSALVLEAGPRWQA